MVMCLICTKFDKNGHSTLKLLFIRGNPKSNLLFEYICCAQVLFIQYLPVGKVYNNLLWLLTLRHKNKKA
ncbi:hypothetical protein M23134_07500 [Microscilla marina ATCC 23134]|uniref:Uncharacterized protein n=1 Tax=Microscilla marina ATCC 23134 TaxID=313606 RepID=A1ZEZ1_MICM2|nr:hypothetical protein M23134_07500 [Microscilla marina ATCC 23134]